MGGRALAVAAVIALATGAAFVARDAHRRRVDQHDPRPSAIPTGASANQLNGVSCPSCHALLRGGPIGCHRVGAAMERQDLVGRREPQTDREHARGRVVPRARRAASPSAAKRVAGAKQALVEAWNGNTWSIVTVPGPTGATGAAARGDRVHEPDVLSRGGHPVRCRRGRLEDAHRALERQAVEHHHQPQPERRAIARAARRVLRERSELFRSRRLQHRSPAR